MRILALTIFGFYLWFLPLAAFAQTGGAPDVWLGEIAREGLDRPHENYCNSTTETFISMGLSGGSRGFCIEKSERTADTWEEARQTCSSLGKRLPEPAEWKFACNNGSGLSDMTDDWEWASNSMLLIMHIGNGDPLYEVTTMGQGGCSYGSMARVADYNGVEESRVFRCVR